MQILYRIFLEFYKMPNYIATLKHMNNSFMILVDEQQSVVDFIDPVNNNNKYNVIGRFLSKENFYIIVTPISLENNYLLEVKDKNNRSIKPISIKFYSQNNSVYCDTFIQIENKYKYEYIENNHKVKTMNVVQITCKNASNIENAEVYF